MAHARVGPFAANATLTSAQMNSVDLNATNSVDNTTAGDTVLGPILFSGASATLNLNGAAIAATLYAGKTFQISGTLQLASGASALYTSGSNLTVTSGANVTIPLAAGSTVFTVNGTNGSISLGNGPTDIKTPALAVTGTQSVTNASTTVAFSAAQTLLIGTAIVFASQPASTYYLAAAINGGTSGTLTTAYTGTTNAATTATVAFTRTEVQPAIALPSPFAGWSGAYNAINGNPAIIGPATTQAQYLSLPKMHNGATLSSVTLYMSVKGTHTGIPATMPSFNVYRIKIAGGALTVSLAASSAVFPTPSSAGAWDATGNTQSLTLTCSQNNVLDTTQYYYMVSLLDESGTNSVAGNYYYGFLLSYTGIADMRFA